MSEVPLQVARLREDTDRRIEEEAARSVADNLLACQLRAEAVISKQSSRLD